MPSDLRPLPEHLAEKAKREVNEDPSTRHQAIAALRRSILSDPRLNFQTDDAFLLKFLRAWKFDEEKAFQLVKSYYKQRRKYPEFFKNLSAANYRHVMSCNYYGILASRDDQGSPIVYTNALTTWNPDTTSLEDITANILLSMELISELEDTQINGLVSIVNCRGMTWSHIACCNPSSVRLNQAVTHDFTSVRAKAVHFIFQPKLFSAGFQLVKPFLTRELKNRMFFHGDSLESLHKHFRPEILPEDLGGTLGPFSTEDWNRKILENDKVLKRNLEFGYVSD